MQKLVITAGITLALFSLFARADFFKDLGNSLERSLTDTAEDIAIEATAKLIEGMIVKYTTRRTRSEKEVREDYVKEKGELPRITTAASYRSEILPGSLVSPGDDVRIRSYIEVVPGNTGAEALIEERLTIWDNEDNQLALKAMTKEAGKESGGVFRGEFSFTLPEGLPQGLYPITTELMLDGELSGDRKLQLQLVLYKNGDGALLVASYRAPN